MKKKYAPFMFLLLLALSAGPAAAASIAVVIPSEARVSGSQILLGEIASIDYDLGAGPEIKAWAAALAQISLGLSPEPGRSLTLRGGQIEQRLKAAGGPLLEADWHLPESLTVSRPGQTMDEARIKNIVEDYLSRTEPYQSGLFKILSLTAGPRPSLPPGTVSWEFQAQKSSNPTSLVGQIFFQVDGRDAGRLRVAVQLELLTPAVVAAGNFNRGHVLSEDDLNLAMIDFKRGQGALTDPALAVGWALKVNLAAGSPLRNRDLTKSLLVRRGDIVSIEAKSGGLTITATGQARQDGGLGDTISVVNLSSKKTISARVVAPNQVEVIF